MPTTPQDAYNELIRRLKEIALLASCDWLLSWDQETYMPKGGVFNRAQQRALLAGIVHERETAPEIGELLARVEESDLLADPRSVEAVNMRELRWAYERRVKLPRSLVEALAQATTLAVTAWTEARAESNFAHFRPHLERILALKRQEAEALAGDGFRYDALLENFEPGETTDNLHRLFEPLRTELVTLVQAIVASGRTLDTSILEGDFPLERQKMFVQEAAAVIGFDFAGGRLDETAHPFAIPIGPGDVRITTRYHPYRLADALLAGIHEAGHGIHFQALLNSEHYATPMGEPISAGNMESQSRLWENIVGHSRAFWQHLLPKAQQIFPQALGHVSLDEFYAVINHVDPSFIRVSADEVTYNLHILIRFEMEQALVNGDLAAGDVPGAWNDLYERYLGVTPPDDARGCLQDIHWSLGLIGYFPTYTLGNLSAAQFYEQIRADLVDPESQFAAGEFAPLKEWLVENIYRHGKRYRAGELVEALTGRPLSHEPLVAYLRAKYQPLYGLS